MVEEMFPGDQRVAQEEHNKLGYHHCPGCGAVMHSLYVYCVGCSGNAPDPYLEIYSFRERCPYCGHPYPEGFTGGECPYCGAV